MDFLHFVNRFYKQMCRWKSVKQIQHIYPLDQSYKVSLFSRCENDYIRGLGEIKQIQSISANICWVFTKHFHCQYCVWKYVYVWCWEVWSWHMLLRCRPGRVYRLSPFPSLSVKILNAEIAAKLIITTNFEFIVFSCCWKCPQHQLCFQSIRILHHCKLAKLLQNLRP